MLHPVYYVTRIDKALWFGEYCQWCRDNALDRLGGVQPRFAVCFSIGG
jgi:hypothetical protein